MAFVPDCSVPMAWVSPTAGLYPRVYGGTEVLGHCRSCFSRRVSLQPVPRVVGTEATGSALILGRPGNGRLHAADECLERGHCFLMLLAGLLSVFLSAEAHQAESVQH